MTDSVLGPVKGDVTAECVLTALVAGRAMRTHQKEYFATRQQAALDASRVAERAFDDALANALWWILHGEQRPVRRVVVCDRCGGADTFRVVGRFRNVQYLKCSACGRRATQLVLAPGGAGAEKGEQKT